MTRTPALAIVAILGLTAGFVLAAPATDLLDFSDPKARTAEFIRLYDEMLSEQHAAGITDSASNLIFSCASVSSISS